MEEDDEKKKKKNHDKIIIRGAMEEEENIAINNEVLMKKRVLLKGTQEDHSLLIEGCPVHVHFIARSFPDKKIIATTKDVVDGKFAGGADEPIMFHLFRFDHDEDEEDGFIEDPTGPVRGIPKALHYAVSTMRTGERSFFHILDAKSIGWINAILRGRGQMIHSKPELEEGTNQSTLEIELISWEKDPLPRFPSRKEMEQMKEQEEQEERKRARDYPPQTVKERLENSNKARLEGNELFKKQDYRAAQKRYDTAFVHIFFTAEDWENVEEKEEVEKARRVLHLNRAMCKIKLKDFDSAEFDCDKSIDDVDPRPYYRRGIVYLERLKSLLRKELAGEYWDVDVAWKVYHHAEEDYRKAKELTQQQQDKKTSLEYLHSNLEKCKMWLIKYTKDFEKAQKDLYRNRMFKAYHNHNNKSSSTSSSAGTKKKDSSDNDDDDLPELES